MSRAMMAESSPRFLSQLPNVRRRSLGEARLIPTRVQCQASAPVGQWFHVGVNFGKTTGLQLFVDHKQASGTHNITFGGPGYVCSQSRTCGSSSLAGIAGNTNPWVIGASAMQSGEGNGTPATNPLAGAIDEVRISKKPRAF
jgi:hypothetical protein